MAKLQIDQVLEQMSDDQLLCMVWLRWWLVGWGSSRGRLGQLYCSPWWSFEQGWKWRRWGWGAWWNRYHFPGFFHRGILFFHQAATLFRTLPMSCLLICHQAASLLFKDSSTILPPILPSNSTALTVASTTEQVPIYSTSPQHIFTPVPGPKIILDPHSQPYDFFLQIWGADTFQLIADQTTLWASLPR